MKIASDNFIETIKKLSIFEKKYMNKVKNNTKKEPHQLIFIEKFCVFSVLQIEHVFVIVIKNQPKSLRLAF